MQEDINRFKEQKAKLQQERAKVEADLSARDAILQQREEQLAVATRQRDAERAKWLQEEEERRTRSLAELRQVEDAVAQANRALRQVYSAVVCWCSHCTVLHTSNYMNVPRCMHECAEHATILFSVAG